MLHAVVPQRGGQNRLLALLPADEYARLQPHLEPMSLPLKLLLCDVQRTISHVYFPRTGVVSLVSVMEDGTLVETATVGNEGMAGLPVFLGARSSPVRAFVQVPGEALRLPADVLRQEATTGSTLHRVLQGYTQALMVQMAQGAACNRVHAIEERCAKWLLMTHDRMEEDTYLLTQEFLAQMLGVRRATVSVAAAILRTAGVIRYSRGMITIVDRAGLEEASCECYGIIAQEYARLLSGENRRDAL